MTDVKTMTISTRSRRGSRASAERDEGDQAGRQLRLRRFPKSAISSEERSPAGLTLTSSTSFCSTPHTGGAAMNLLEIVKRLEQMSADYGSFPRATLQSSVNRLAAELKRAGEDGACSCGAKLVEYKHRRSRALCKRWWYDSVGTRRTRSRT